MLKAGQEDLSELINSEMYTQMEKGTEMESEKESGGKLKN